MEKHTTNLMILGVVAVVAIFALAITLNLANGTNTAGAALRAAPTASKALVAEPEYSAYFWCADTDGSGQNDIADLTRMVNYMFRNGTNLTNGTGDVNGDCSIDIGDITHLVDYMFQGGADPVCDSNCTSTDPPTMNLSIWQSGNDVYANCYIFQENTGITNKYFTLSNPSGTPSTTPLWSCGSGGGPGYSYSTCSATLSDQVEIGSWETFCSAVNSNGQETYRTESLFVSSICGNGVCEPAENEQTCPQDCTSTELPDLVVLSAWYVPMVNDTNQTNQSHIKLRVRNMGDAQSSYFYVESILHEIYNDTQNLFVPGLNPGQEIYLEHSFPSRVPYGTWQYTAFADSTYRIVESNENNNAFSTTLTIY